MHSIMRWTTALFYIVALTVLMLRQFPAGPALFPQADKVAHFFFMGLLALLLIRAMTPALSDKPSLLAWVVALGFSIGYAVAIEFIQPHFHRTFDVWDMVAGALGIIVLTVAWAKLRLRSVFLR